nr:MAG TPA: hypothetical protein [Caudoviricetes sp.]
MLVELRRGAGRSVHARYMLPCLYTRTPGRVRDKNKNIFKKLLKMLDNVVNI